METTILKQLLGLFLMLTNNLHGAYRVRVQCLYLLLDRYQWKKDQNPLFGVLVKTTEEDI